MSGQTWWEQYTESRPADFAVGPSGNPYMLRWYVTPRGKRLANGWDCNHKGDDAPDGHGERLAEGRTQADKRAQKKAEGRHRPIAGRGFAGSRKFNGEISWKT